MTKGRRGFAGFALALSISCSASDRAQRSEGAPVRDDAAAGGSASAGRDSPSSVDERSCDVATHVAGLTVKTDDLAAYPPYAASGCSLAYVAADGVLRIRDLVSGEDSVVAPAAEEPRRPAISKSTLVWEARALGKSIVRVHREGTTHSITGPFENAGEPRVSADAVSFSAWDGDSTAGSADTDVWLYDSVTRSAKIVIGGASQQRFSDVSDAWVVATDFAEDPDGAYQGDGTDLGDIVTYDRATGTRTSRPLPGKQAFPVIVSDSVFGFLDWNLVRPEPKLEAYDLRVGSFVGPIADRTIAAVKNVAATSYIRPSSLDGSLVWVDNVTGSPRLLRAAVDAPSEPVVLAAPSGLLFAPISVRVGVETAPGRFTILATSESAKPIALRVAAW